MAFCLQGFPVSRGVAIGRAVRIAPTHLDVARYFIEPDQVDAEWERLRAARDAVAHELRQLALSLQRDKAAETSSELLALLEVHLMLLHDEMLAASVRDIITQRRYGAEWALVTQLEITSKQFDEMADPYLRERKADVQQVVDRMLRHLKGTPSPTSLSASATTQLNAGQGEAANTPLVLVAHDLSPADMLNFKKTVFAGFVTDVGGKTSHTAIVARSMDIPAVVGARSASQLVRQGDMVIIDGDAGVLIVEPSPILLQEYAFKQRQGEIERERLNRLIHTPAVTLDGQEIELLANIEVPSDATAARNVGAMGVGLFRSEFLFMGRGGDLPSEDEQYESYRLAVQNMNGRPVTIRTVDVGADKPLDGHKSDQLNPALGLRAIRWSLSEPSMFLAQLRAILRAAAHGPVHLLLPMLGSVKEAKQALGFIERARQELQARDVAHGAVQVGAMIEVPGAALMAREFAQLFDFLSIGTNDLIQYTLAIDRADEAVAHLYDPLHPAVLRLVETTIREGRAAGKPVTVCGEMAGDPSMTRLLLGLGLRSFSMHPTRILPIKKEVLQSDTHKLAPWANALLRSDDVQAAMDHAPGG
ncbi:phosphoenolpyruvate--protein phosphotransferase [Comamonas serinivorans]|uniref:Phosphoenolpyruvate-protein phosphotransferase n=1 Tax=Comamonas serinivorans TaxID=1082851 RepID=A0A1Y0EID5_9BURK|nr:phosphoenolpyruvate--protein phosphotransferase [Comamonas serinivorans]ARU03365.1 phosphoenolpyruvate--protein phosphotransferase [Comamonas serinivorans]